MPIMKIESWERGVFVFGVGRGGRIWLVDNDATYKTSTSL